MLHVLQLKLSVLRDSYVRNTVKRLNNAAGIGRSSFQNIDMGLFPDGTPSRFTGLSAMKG